MDENMKNKIELEIVALSHSLSQTHSYAVVLGESKGLRRLPIVIGGFEAQAIAVAIENMKPSRPLTHDLMKNFMEAFGVTLNEVIISNLNDGIFYSKLICTGSEGTIEIDSRTSDALALSVRCGCPIYTYETILEQAGINKEETGGGKQRKTDPEPSEKDLKTMSLGELDRMLKEVLEREDYMQAISIRDEINRRKEAEQ